MLKNTFIKKCPRCKKFMKNNIYYAIHRGGYAIFYTCSYCKWKEEVPVGLFGLLK